MAIQKLRTLTGKGVNSGVEESAGGTTLTGDGITFYQLLTIQMALKIQERGVRLSARTPMGTTLARKLMGLRGNRESLLQQVTAIVERIQAERDEERAERQPGH